MVIDMPPPTSTRFCLSCQAMTEWKYNRVIGHSRCTECGSAYSARHEIPPETISELVGQLMPWIKQHPESKVINSEKC